MKNVYRYCPKTAYGEESVEFDLIGSDGVYHTTMVVFINGLIAGRKQFSCVNGDEYPLTQNQKSEIASLVLQERRKRMGFETVKSMEIEAVEAIKELERLCSANPDKRNVRLVKNQEEYCKLVVEELPQESTEGGNVLYASDYEEIPQMEGFTGEQKHRIFELTLYAVNCGDLVQHFCSTQKSLYQKYLNGEYDDLLADKAFYNFVPKVIEKYKRELGTRFLLTDPEKWAVAKELRKHFTMDFETDLAHEQIGGKKTMAKKEQQTTIEKMERMFIQRQHGDVQFTPMDTARELIEEYADLHQDSIVLEPSAGIARLAGVAGERAKRVDVIEKDPDMRQFLIQKGYSVVGEDFLEFDRTGVYDRIIMNPPFSRNQDIKHLKHAYELLMPGGKLLCLTSKHWDIAKDKKILEFNKWIESKSGEVHQLDRGTFENTNVSCNVVILTKPKVIKSIRGKRICCES